MADMTVSAALPGGPLVLVGPLAAGKTTTGCAVASLSDRPLCSLDDLRWQYYADLGYDPDEAARRFEAGGTAAERMAYGMPYEAHAVEQVVADFPDCVIDLGASNSVYEDPELSARVQRALSRTNVVLLLPDADPVRCRRVLRERLQQISRTKGEAVSETLLELNEYFVSHPSNARLARRVVFTDGRSPTDVAHEVVAWLGAVPDRSPATADG
jgi:hypothetical protein